MDAKAEVSYVKPFVNTTLLPMLLLSLARQKNTPSRAKTVKTEYDYVIVGAGSAGSVVASRLSELPCVTVLLLEAGKSPPILTEVPSFRRFYLSSDIDWQYKTVPQRHTGEGLVNKEVVWPSGKAVGGSSIFSRDTFNTGKKEDFDKWVDEGAKGWSYDEMLPYFRKLEDCKENEEFNNDFQFRSPFPSEEKRRSNTNFEDAIVMAAQSFGYKIDVPTPHQQSGRHNGLPSTAKLGQGCSASKTYLVRAENRSNLDVLPNAMARKVLIKNHQAVGVQFDFRGITYEVKAKKEVILSAGTINTAQLLMLSGIGPRNQLDRFKIPVLADLPVGMNLQDHVGTFMSFLLNPSEPTVTEKITDATNIDQYIRNRAGPLASTHIFQALPPQKNSFFSEADTSNHELYFVEAQPEIIRNEVGLKPKVFEKLFGSNRERPFYHCVSSVLHPSSKGTVTLNSDDPYDAPVIDPNYLEDNGDVQNIVEGLKNCLSIGRHADMKRVGSYPLATSIPGCEKYDSVQDLYLECVAKNIVISLNHPVGTARMGSAEDTRTVVDPQLRVLRIQNLRVVDASVMPVIPSGGTYLPTMALAEKAADIIKSTTECNNKRSDTSSIDETWLPETHIFQTIPSIIHNHEKVPSFKKDSFDFSAEVAEDFNHPHTLRNIKSKSFNKHPKDVLQNSNRKEPSKVEFNNRKSNKTLLNVTPWNKEVPFVVPWNQELVQQIISNDTFSLVSNITNIIANLVPGNQGSSQPNFSNNSSVQSTNLLPNQNSQTVSSTNAQGSSSLLQSPNSNSLRPQIPASPPKFQGNISFQTSKFNKSVNLQINKPSQLLLANKIRELKSKIQKNLLELLNSSTPSNMPLNPGIVLNSDKTRPPVNPALLEYITKMKKLKLGDQKYCNYFLNNMSCQAFQCQKLKIISNYLFNILCRS